jgi:hypothetical protein
MDIPKAKEKQPTDENKLSRYWGTQARGCSDMDSTPNCFPLCTKLTDANADALLLFTSLCCGPTSENAVFHLGNPFMLGSNCGGEESAELRVLLSSNLLA